MDEFLEIVSPEGEVIGLARRSEIHGNPSLIHRVVHVLVFDAKGRLLLQKRSMRKDTEPGKWDTSVGGHVNPGEEVMAAALREMEEELGITGCQPRFLHSYLFSNDRESELVSTFSCLHEREVCFNTEEVDEVRFWDLGSIKAGLGTSVFTPHFEKEMETFLKGKTDPRPSAPQV